MGTLSPPPGDKTNYTMNVEVGSYMSTVHNTWFANYIHVCVKVGNQRVELTLSELQEMATRQQQQIEAQQQMLVAKVISFVT